MHKILFDRYTPKKYLGQNFLKDQNIINKIINVINPKKKDLLVEVGPGLAALTKPICNIIDNLVIIELDDDILNILKDCNFYKKLYVFRKNVIHFDFKKLSIKKNNVLRIFGNIPYNISVKLILYLINFQKYISDINFMVQKEVANRLVAKPGTKKYGRLSIVTQCYYDVGIIFNIDPCAFYPIPKVHSSFITMVPKAFPLCSMDKIHILQKITALAFKYRRKMLKNSLFNCINQRILMNLNINPNLRPENISVDEYCKIVNSVYLEENNYN